MSPSLDRVRELLSKMPIPDKIANVGANAAAGVPALGIPPFQWWGEALHGVYVSEIQCVSAKFSVYQQRIYCM